MCIPDIKKRYFIITFFKKYFRALVSNKDFMKYQNKVLNLHLTELEKIKNKILKIKR